MPDKQTYGVKVQAWGSAQQTGGVEVTRKAVISGRDAQPGESSGRTSSKAEASRAWVKTTWERGREKPGTSDPDAQKGGL